MNTLMHVGSGNVDRSTPQQRRRSQVPVVHKICGSVHLVAALGFPSLCVFNYAAFNLHRFVVLFHGHNTRIKSLTQIVFKFARSVTVYIYIF